MRNGNLSDAAMGEILTLLKRKGEEYGVHVVAIGQYKKSTQTCSKCGFVKREKQKIQNKEAGFVLNVERFMIETLMLQLIFLEYG